MVRGWFNQLALAMALGSGSMGCMAIGAVQTAQTLGQGNYEVSIEPGVYGAAVSGQTPTYFSMNVGVRFGVTDRFDLGGRVGTTFGEVQTKILLSDPANENFALSLAPAIGGFGVGTGVASVGILNIPLPVLIGFKFGEHELTLGPRFQNLVLFASEEVSSANASATSYVLMAGASVGFAAQLADRFRLLPEIAIAGPIFGSATASVNGGTQSQTSSGFVTEVGGLLFMGNLGFQITSPRKKREPKAPEPPKQWANSQGPADRFSN